MPLLSGQVITIKTIPHDPMCVRSKVRYLVIVYEFNAGVLTPGQKICVLWRKKTDLMQNF